MATIKDVAREAGLGVGTVSRYLNGVELKPINKERIERAIQKLGYRRNALARSMKLGRSMTIAIVVPNLSNMFTMRVIESIENALEGAEYSAIVADCGNREDNQLRKLAFLKDKMVDGFVLMPMGNSAQTILQTVGDAPVVLIDRVFEDCPLDSVSIDNEKAAYDAMRASLEKPFTKVGILEGPKAVSTARDRSRGYERALEERGIRKEYVLCGNYGYDEGYAGAKTLIAQGVDLLFTSNYELTVGAINAISQSGKKVRLVGFDTVELASLLQGAYTFITQPMEGIGRRAAQLLLDRIADPTLPPRREIIPLEP